MFFSIFKHLGIAVFVTAAVFAYTPVAHAADPKHVIKDPAYAAKYVSQSISDPVEIEAGTTKTVVFKFKNVGTATWDANKRFISAYTIEPRYRKSVFQGSSWIADRQTGKIAGTVKPGDVGELKLELKAPEKTGVYKEEFYLAAENQTWVQSGYFFLKINVVARKQATATPKTESATPEVSKANTELQAKKLILDKKQIDARGGEEIPVIVAFQNIGNATWNSYAIKTSVISSVVAASVSSEPSQVVLEKSAVLPQWSVARETIMLKVPKEKGNYTVGVKLSANGTDLSEVLGTISVNVTENAAFIENTVTTPVAEIIPRLDHEPRIRVGVWKDPANGVKFVSEDDDYTVYDGTTPAGILPRGIQATVEYSGGIYYFTGGGMTISSGEYIRLEPVTNIHSVFRLTNYERLVSWKGAHNFNAYRGAMEYRATKSGEGVYVIEETMFEDYVAGIAETSDGSPVEYIKALLTAARTYAYFIQNSSSKHDTRFFDVVATTGDQLYLGYESEVIMPRVAEAARATRGTMITYDLDSNIDTPTEVVITPYFANTNGRTKSWKEVWGGAERPWLVSVIAEFDKRDGKKLLGHGVGMSARDAAIRADELGESFDTILKYYYTGVQVEKMYQ